MEILLPCFKEMKCKALEVKTKYTPYEVNFAFLLNQNMPKQQADRNKEKKSKTKRIIVFK